MFYVYFAAKIQSFFEYKGLLQRFNSILLIFWPYDSVIVLRWIYGG